MKLEPVRLLTGGDLALLSEAVQKTVDELSGDIDRSTDVHELHNEEYAVDDVVFAASTPPLFSEHRVVVVRGLDDFGTADLKPLLDYLAEPTPTTALVLEWGTSRPPKPLQDAVKAAGGSVVSAAAPTRRGDRKEWLGEQFKAAGINLDSTAAQLVDDHLGEDLSRVAGLLEILEAVYGPDTRLGSDEVELYLGATGGVPPWDLTDAIDKGETKQALKVLQRMWLANDNPMRVMPYLIGHYRNMLRLEGLEGGSAGRLNEKDAAQVLGVRSSFTAGKALRNVRRLGGSGIRRAIELLACADADMRGMSGLDNRYVMEVLVGRLAEANRMRLRS